MRDVEHQAGTPCRDRRQTHDRRGWPTSLSNALGLRGHRQRFRRTEEGSDAYVDCLAPRIVVLAVFVLICSALDALFTILHIQHGGQEANPLMALALAHGYTTFVGVKMALTGAGVWFLAAHQQFPLASKALPSLGCVYVVLLAYHLVLLCGLAV